MATIRIGRDPRGVESAWTNADETVAVVETKHEPPKYIIFDRPHGGGSWMRVPNKEFKTLQNAVRYARRLS